LPPGQTAAKLEKIEPSAVVHALIAQAARQKLIDPSAAVDAGEEMFEGVLTAREYAKESTEEGLTGN
jgi:hypothetical protein